MNLRSRRAEDVRSERTVPPPDRSQGATGISRRAILRASSGTAVVAGVGLAGWLEILKHREALAAGTVIVIGGITREPNEADETPHRHTFNARFTVSSISPSAILGDVSGRTAAVISTSSVEEDQHFHVIEGTDVSLEDLLLSGTEDNLPGEHAHLVSIE